MSSLASNQSASHTSRSSYVSDNYRIRTQEGRKNPLGSYTNGGNFTKERQKMTGDTLSVKNYEVIFSTEYSLVPEYHSPTAEE